MNNNCKQYIEDPCICDDIGEPKGQCINCGGKWFEHDDDALPLEERNSKKTLALDE